MQCRQGCGACCIAPSIAQGFYGMPAGKRAGEVCVHLDKAMQCALFGDAKRPDLCAAFKADYAVCADDREQALMLLAQMELDSQPDIIALRSSL